MESLRTQALQRELNRIEDEAKAHSLAAMNIADDLAAAAQLCLLINSGMQSEDAIEPVVCYHSKGLAVVNIYAHYLGLFLLQRAEEIELQWTDHGVAWDKTHRLSFSGFINVEVYVHADYIARYNAQQQVAA